jgi:DNA-binding NtrC family response regulator
MVQRVYVFEDRRTELLDALLVTGETPVSPPPPSASGGTPDAPTEDVPAGEPAVPVFNLVELRRLAVRQALTATDGHRGHAAQLLGVSLNTMTRLVAECCPEHAAARAGRKRSVTSAKPR